MKEQALLLGAQHNLLGILTLPAQPQAGCPALIFPNTGLDPRCGPNRLHVELARGLAHAGYASLRLDLAGLGDSDPAPGARPNPVADLRLAMDELQRRGIANTFGLIGLCSGAHDAYHTAQADPRVTGVVLLDGYAYPTPKFRWLRFWQRASLLLQPARIVNGLRRLTGTGEMPSVSISLFQSPALELVREGMHQLVRSGVALGIVYTGQVQREFNHEDQLWDMFPALRGYSRLTYRYMIHADHIFSRRAQREELLTLLKAWLEQHF